MGFMGSGKTTLGRTLHAATAIDFVDLDDAIEESRSMSIKEIFAKYGEAKFREIETETLLKVSQAKGIVACGGGTPCFGNNMELMNSLGTTIWLQAPIDLLVERLLCASAKRPLIAGMTREQLQAYVTKTVDTRSAFYSKATERFDASDLDTAEGIERSVAAFIQKFIN
jgi:shikimate kinase